MDYLEQNSKYFFRDESEYGVWLVSGESMKSRLVLLLGLLLYVGAQLTAAQHWSHGWYPGGKRELDSFGAPEVRISVSALVRHLITHRSSIETEDSDVVFLQISEDIKLCEAGECGYLRPQRRNILRDIVVSEQIEYPPVCCTIE